MELPAGGDPTTGTPPGQKAWLKYKRIAQTYLDKTVIFPTQRWAFFGFSLLLYNSLFQLLASRLLSPIDPIAGGDNSLMSQFYLIT